MEQKTRDKIAWGLAVVLIPVFVYLVAVNFFNLGGESPGRSHTAVPVPPFEPSAPVSVTSVDGPARRGPDPDVIAEQKRIAAGLPSRNPFIALKSEISPVERERSKEEFSYKVTAIISAPGSNKRMAMINGRMFEEGDRIGEWTILRVGDRDVLFDNGVQRRTVGVK